MNRSFTVTSNLDKKTYEGFDGKWKDAVVIAVVDFEGDPDVWALDSPESVKELERYYKEFYDATFKIRVFES